MSVPMTSALGKSSAKSLGEKGEGLVSEIRALLVDRLSSKFLKWKADSGQRTWPKYLEEPTG